MGRKLSWATLTAGAALSAALAAGFESRDRASAPPRRQPLADPTLAATPEQRQFLKYLVGCALPESVELYADIGGERFAFPGSLGLAPAWAERGLAETEQRWVSACILARTNLFGKTVPVSMRARVPAHPALETDSKERQTYTLPEGGFFGNLFAERPVAYVCAGDRTPAQAADPVLAERVCTAPSGRRTANGDPITRCGFIAVGACGETSRYTVNGETYTEVIFAYLKPGHIDSREPVRLETRARHSCMNGLFQCER